MNIGEYIKKERLNKRISIRELERNMKIDRSYISKIENGIIKKPGIDFLIKISHELNLNLKELFKISKVNEKEFFSYRYQSMYNQSLIFFELNKKDINKYLSYFKNFEGFEGLNIKTIDYSKVLDDYKKGIINKKETFILLMSCTPFETNKEIIYPSEEEVIKIYNELK